MACDPGLPPGAASTPTPPVAAEPAPVHQSMPVCNQDLAIRIPRRAGNIHGAIVDDVLHMGGSMTPIGSCIKAISRSVSVVGGLWADHSKAEPSYILLIIRYESGSRIYVIRERGDHHCVVDKNDRCVAEVRALGNSFSFSQLPADVSPIVPGDRATPPSPPPVPPTPPSLTAPVPPRLPPEDATPIPPTSFLRQHASHAATGDGRVYLQEPFAQTVCDYRNYPNYYNTHIRLSNPPRNGPIDDGSDGAKYESTKTVAAYGHDRSYYGFYLSTFRSAHPPHTKHSSFYRIPNEISIAVSGTTSVVIVPSFEGRNVTWSLYRLTFEWERTWSTITKGIGTVSVELIWDGSCNTRKRVGRYVYDSILNRSIRYFYSVPKVPNSGDSTTTRRTHRTRFIWCDPDHRLLQEHAIAWSKFDQAWEVYENVRYKAWEDYLDVWEDFEYAWRDYWDDWDLRDRPPRPSRPQPHPPDLEKPEWEWCGAKYQ